AGSVIGGLPVASAGQPFGDAVRETDVAGSPLTDNPGDINVQLVVATATGPQTVSVAATAAERANDPNVVQDRLNAALNQAGLYVGAASNLTQFLTAEDTGERIQSLSINGVAQTLSQAPIGGIGGAFSTERSFTSSQAAANAGDDIAALQAN